MQPDANEFELHAGELLARAVRAGAALASLNQAAVDRIVEAAFRAAFDARIPLARLAHEETGMGVVEHKALKNAWASLLVFERIRGERTVGVVRDDAATGITEIAHPVGPVLGIVPVTNPTSTTILKSLLCLKTRNPVLFSFHRGARKCSREAARVMSEAAQAAGAPADSIQWIGKAQIEFVEAVMRHRDLALIVASGTRSVVERAQRSGTPTFGVGPGNVPVYVHESADFARAARQIVHSKTFDNGTVCASEQALVVEPSAAGALRPWLVERGAFFCSPDQTRALGPVCFDTDARTMRADVVGQPAAVIAARAGISVPAGTRLLIAEPEGIGPGHPLSYEILAPVLAQYRVRDFSEALATCRAITRLGGIGHTVSVHCEDEAVIEAFSTMDAARILVNTPATEGALGGVFNHLFPSLTLACGTGAKNISTDNLGLRHLLNVYRVVRPQGDASWLGVPGTAWLDPTLTADHALDLYRAPSSGS